MITKLMKEFFEEEAERIEEELKNVDFETEYGLTSERMKEIKERIYRNILKEIERRNENKSQS